MSTDICVTICTRERPQMLARCLASVLPQLQHSQRNTSLVVIENGGEPTCRDAVLAMRKRFPAVRIEYELERELGIPFARNRAVEVALQIGANWIVFIDDDEEAHTDWFDKLTSAIGEWDADVYHGKVTLIYPDRHPEWMRMKSFNAGVSGTVLDTAATNNTMARARLFSEDGFGLRFDTRLRFTGGEDVELFHRAAKAGATIRWIGDAVVFERIPEQRLSADWLCKRTRSQAASAAMVVIRGHSFRTAARIIAVRCARLMLELVFHAAMATITFVAPGMYSKHHFKVQDKISKIAGYLDPMSGVFLDPYRSVEGE